MNTTLVLIFALFLIVIWIIAGVFITITEINVKPYSGQDPLMGKGYTYAFWAAFVTWFLLALFIVLVIGGAALLYSSGAGEAEAGEAALEEFEAQQAEGGAGGFKGLGERKEIKGGANAVAVILISLFIGLLFITGILAALSAYDIVESPIFDPTNASLNKAYIDAIVAASLSLGIVGLLIIGLITYVVVSKTSKSSKKRSKEYGSTGGQELEYHVKYQ